MSLDSRGCLGYVPPAKKSIVTSVPGRAHRADGKNTAGIALAVKQEEEQYAKLYETGNDDCNGYRHERNRLRGR